MASSLRRPSPIATSAGPLRARRVALIPGTRLADPTYARVLAGLMSALRGRGWSARAFCPSSRSLSALRRFRPALVNVHFSGHLSSPALRLIAKARASGAALALTFQDIDHPDMKAPTARRAARLSRLVAAAGAVTALTPALARQVRRRHGRRADVIGNGVSPRWFGAAAARNGPIVCVARLSPYKGIDLLLWAFADLALSRPRARLVVYGADFQSGHYQRLAAALGLSRRLRFAGQVGTGALRRALSRARLVVSASRRETYGLALLEAMAGGAPVLATGTGAAAELMRHGRSGWLVPAGDPGALSDALRRLWDDAALRARLGAGARRAAARHGWGARAARYEAVFRKALRG